MSLKRAVLTAGLIAAGTVPLIALADEWEYRRESNRYQTGRVDVDVDDDAFDVDLNDDGFDVDVGSRRYEVDLDDFDVDRLDRGTIDVDVDDDDGWRASVRGEWSPGYESDRALSYEWYDLEPGPYDRYERGYVSREDRSRDDADRTFERKPPEPRQDLRYDDRELRRSTSTQVPDRGVGQYFGSTTPEERYYHRGSEFFSRSSPPANRFNTGLYRPGGTAFRDDASNRYATRYERWSNTARDGWYDEDDNGTAYTYDYEIEYDLDTDD